MNTWGLRYPLGSDIDEEERLKLLSEHLKKTNYDFVLLQEVWYLSQYEHVKGVLPYITEFQALNNGRCYEGLFSPIGCSGLVILSRHPILFAELQPFLSSGDIWSGDLFVRKGIGRARVLLWNKYTIDLFTTHLVTYQNDPDLQNPRVRFLQATQTAQLIKSSNADIKILGGDFNAKPNLGKSRFT